VRAGLQTLLSRGGSGRVMRDTALITGKIGNAEEYPKSGMLRNIYVRRLGDRLGVWSLGSA
jgi:hypothetical protein